MSREPEGCRGQSGWIESTTSGLMKRVNLIGSGSRKECCEDWAAVFYPDRKARAASWGLIPGGKPAFQSVSFLDLYQYRSPFFFRHQWPPLCQSSITMSFVMGQDP